MNILMVDDQREIVNSLKNGIRWDTLPVEQVYTACSAKEAKLVLVNFQVDVLITDIEMSLLQALSGLSYPLHLSAWGLPHKLLLSFF